MPHLEELNHIRVKELHPTFGAEVSGVDFSKSVDENIFQQIKAAAIKYGVLYFRNSNIDDRHHVEFAARFGELDDIKPYVKAGRRNRLAFDELFDVSNLDDDGNLLDPSSYRGHLKKGNGLFHVDSSFNPRRAGYSLLRAHELPPKGTGGNTSFADTRTAFEDLPDSIKATLLEKDYVVCHSLWHSRKSASPEFFRDINPEDYPMSRHKLIQRHEPSGRMNLYIAAHAHHIEGISAEESKILLDTLFKHATQPKYVLSIEWQENGDLILWDNTCVMHKSAGGSFEGKYKRDMRRATVHDMSIHSWGLNEQVDTRQGMP